MMTINALRALALAGLLALPAWPATAQPGIHDDSLTATATPKPPTATRGGTIVLDFEGLGNLEPVLDFYNGGTGGNGSGPGTDFGISFSANSLAIIDADAGGTGNFGGEPSPDTVLFFLTGGGGKRGAAATMNVPAGFETGFSFYYSAINNPGLIRVFDGLDGTGNLLATLDLPLTPSNGAPDPDGQFSPLVPVGVTFDGIARSVDFGGTVDQVAFDNITLGSGTPGGGPVGTGESRPVPAGSAWSLLLMTALLALAALVALRRGG